MRLASERDNLSAVSRRREAHKTMRASDLVLWDRKDIHNIHTRTYNVCRLRS